MTIYPRRVLISGASIAGPALALLAPPLRHRHRVVERAPALRTGGQNVDVRGAGREVARRMGIEDDDPRRHHGRGRHPVRRPTAVRSPSSRPVLRLRRRHRRARDPARRPRAAPRRPHAERHRVPLRRPDHGASHEDDDGVDRVVRARPDERFDLVVAADGIGRAPGGWSSATSRRSARSGSRPPTPRSRARRRTTTGGAGTTHRGRSITLRPDPHGTIRAALSS